MRTLFVSHKEAAGFSFNSWLHYAQHKGFSMYRPITITGGIYGWLLEQEE